MTTVVTTTVDEVLDAMRGVVTHKFWIRPNVQASFELPHGFTRQEADRLNNFINSLVTE